MIDFATCFLSKYSVDLNSKYLDKKQVANNPNGIVTYKVKHGQYGTI